MFRHLAVTILLFLAPIGTGAAGPLSGSANGWTGSVTVEDSSSRQAFAPPLSQQGAEFPARPTQLPSLAALGEGSPVTPDPEPGPGQQGAGPGSHLANVQGKVLLNRGKGFQPVKGDVSVSPGDRVKAVDGFVDIVYWNGTVVPVQSGQIIVVLSDPPAEPGLFGEVPNPVVIGGGAALVGVGVGLAILESHSSPSQAASP